MSRKVKSVRVPEELSTLDLSGIIKDCEHFLRDMESATLLKSQGNMPAAEALIKTRQADLGRRIGLKVWEARVRHGEQRKGKEISDVVESHDSHAIRSDDPRDQL